MNAVAAEPKFKLRSFTQQFTRLLGGTDTLFPDTDTIEDYCPASESDWDEDKNIGVRVARTEAEMSGVVSALYGDDLMSTPLDSINVGGFDTEGHAPFLYAVIEDVPVGFLRFHRRLHGRPDDPQELEEMEDLAEEDVVRAPGLPLELRYHIDFEGVYVSSEHRGKGVATALASVANLLLTRDCVSTVKKLPAYGTPMSLTLYLEAEIHSEGGERVGELMVDYLHVLNSMLPKWMGKKAGNLVRLNKVQYDLVW